MEAWQAVEARCGGLSEKGGGVVVAPGIRVEEGVVGGVEGGEVLGGGVVVSGELGGPAVDGCCDLGEVEDIQGAVIVRWLVLDY